MLATRIGCGVGDFELTEDVSRLLFTLSSEDRVRLLSKINLEKQRLTTLAKVIDASTQECSRHLARLSESGFIGKNSHGFFETTPLGRAVLSLLPGLQFLLKNKNYFLSHSPSFLPQSFAERIGELTEGKLVGHFNLVLEHVKDTILEAREFVWLISDQPVVPTTSLGNAFYSRRLPVRLLLEEGFDLKDFSAAKSVLPEKFEIATMKDVKIAMAINEKVAGVCFPGLDGKIDFGVGFYGTGPQFRGWCSDLFEFSWTRFAEKAAF